MNFLTSSFTLSVLPVTTKVGGILVQESRNIFFFFSKPVVKARSAISSTNLHRCLIPNALDICVSFHPKRRKKNLPTRIKIINVKTVQIHNGLFELTKLTFICSKSTIETLVEVVKYVQS